MHLARVRRLAVACGIFQFSTDQELVAKVTATVDLYLDPRENAMLLRVDEKIADPGSGPHCLDSADADRDTPEANQRLHRRRHHLVRGMGDRNRKADRNLTAPAPVWCFELAAHADPNQELRLMPGDDTHEKVDVRQWRAANSRIQVPIHPRSRCGR